MLHTHAEEKRVRVRQMWARAGWEQDEQYLTVREILSHPARAHIWRTLTRFSSAWVCNIRVKKGERGEKERLLIAVLDNLAGCHSFRLRHLAVPRDPKREMFSPVSS